MSFVNLISFISNPTFINDTTKITFLYGLFV